MKEEPINGLETITSQSSRGGRIAETVKKEARGYISDVFSGTLFYTPIMGANEYFIAGMELDEVLSTRGGMVVTNMFIGRPYGKFRDFWARKVMRADANSSRLKKWATDITAPIMFYAPVYAAMMKMSGASWEETGTALATGMTIVTLSGRPYGWFLDKCRRIMGVKPALDKERI